MDFLTRCLSLVAFLIVAGCGQETPRPPPQGKPQTAIRFVTDWKAQAEHGGFYQALAEGLYAKRGLDVSIVAGGAAGDAPQLLPRGAAGFGIGSEKFIPRNPGRARGQRQAGM